MGKEKERETRPIAISRVLLANSDQPMDGPTKQLTESRARD